MKNTAISFIWFLTLPMIYGQEQKRANNWIIGYDPSSLDSVGMAIQLDFNESPRNISMTNTLNNFSMEGSNTSISDTSGNLLFYSDGCKIVNKNGKIMKNGDGISPGDIQTYFCPAGGNVLKQGVMALPSPEENYYFVFTYDYDEIGSLLLGTARAVTRRLYYQKIDMTKENGLGAVVEKNKIAVFDTLGQSGIQAARHANGKDWWVITSKDNSNCYFLSLIDSIGVHAPLLQCIGGFWPDSATGSGQSVFSPSLKKYVRYNGWDQMQVYDFDNSTGKLSNPIFVEVSKDTTIRSITGVSISPNSRYAYVSAKKWVYQFDLEAPNIEASKVLVATYDGFANPFATVFYLSALAPDGKIYISGTSSAYNLHVIHSPNCAGLSCNLVQHGIELPSYNYATIPNMPHYGLLSQECDTASVKVNNFDEKHALITVYPNPATTTIWLDLKKTAPSKCLIRLFNLLGQTVLTKKIDQTLTEMDITGLPNGTYYYEIQSNSLRSSGKFVKIE